MGRFVRSRRRRPEGAGELPVQRARGTGALKPAARATRNRTVLALVEERAIEEIEAAAEEALASRQKPFSGADVSDGLYGSP